MLFGHQSQWEFLKKSVELNKIPHAILFYGESEIGKKSLAIEFVKFINCLAKDNKKPCGICENCRAIDRKSHPDFFMVEPEELASEIKISQIRELIWKLSLKPYSAFFKTAIIDKAHLMNQESQNCLLKILEEPRGRAILILITEHQETLLPTIISRIQKLRFFPQNTEKIKKYVFQEGLRGEKLEDISFFSFGKAGKANKFIHNPLSIESQKKIITDFFRLAKSDLYFKFKYVKNLSEEDNIKETLNVWTLFLRDILIKKISGQKINSRILAEKTSNDFTVSKIAKNISLIQSTLYLLSTTNISFKLALENLLIEI